jgi:hypothetical protein
VANLRRDGQLKGQRRYKDKRINLLKPKREKERERVKKDNKRAEAKRKLCGRSERRFISGGTMSSFLFEGSQAVLARPYNKDRMKVKTLG